MQFQEAPGPRRKVHMAIFGLGQSEIFGALRPNERVPTAIAAAAMVKFEACITLNESE